jgi:sugar phosphate isomerase/epimerase
VIARPLRMERWERTIDVAKLLGARLIRMHCTPILCGDRANPACNWPGTLNDVRRRLSDVARRAEPHGLMLAIENHQDFGSAELLELCEASGENVGITMDTANPLAVGEHPVEFARAVKPRLRHVHLKDYLVQWTEQGYRLIRCATGGGCIPFRAIADELLDMRLTASIEIGALEARHVKLLMRQWWEHYPPRSAQQLANVLAAARIRRVPENADFQTPWEKNESREAIMAYELEQVKNSVANLRQLGLM